MAALQGNQAQIIEIETAKKRGRKALYFARTHYVEYLNWIDELGPKVYVTWKKLLMHVARTEHAQKTYGNKNTVPYSQLQLAKLLNMAKSTLDAHIRILWNYGCIDLVEWEGSYKPGKKAVNVVVYDYPQNTEKTATLDIVKVRDYAAQYKEGNFPTFFNGAAAAVGTIPPYKAPEAPGAEEEAPGEHMPEPPGEYIPEPPGEYEPEPPGEYIPEAPGEHMPEAAANSQEAGYSNTRKIGYSNIRKIGHNNITNNSFNNSNNDFNNTNNNFNNTNTSFNNSNTYSSSSSQNNTMFEVREEDEAKINEMDRALLEDVIRIKLEEHKIPSSLIEKCVKEAHEQQLALATVETIQAQLEHMADYENSGKRIGCFEKYFVNGLAKRAETVDFYAYNTPEARSKRLFNMHQNDGTASQHPGFYNWLDEREGDPHYMQ